MAETRFLGSRLLGRFDKNLNLMLGDCPWRSQKVK